MQEQIENEISEPTRRDLLDALKHKQVDWAGRLSEREFLSPIFNLSSMESNDRRCSNADDDISPHREQFPDWEDDWIYSDSRFNLLKCDNTTFLQFLCRMVYPIVRPEDDDVEKLVTMLNQYLVRDGWEISQKGEISGKPLYTACLLLDGTSVAFDQAKEVAETLDTNYVTNQINRMQVAIKTDPELAIGTAKEFLETITKTILDQCSIDHQNSEIPRLVKQTLDQIEFTSSVALPTKAERAVRRLLGNLTGIGQSIAEVRNQIGTGHGKPASN